MHTNEKKNNVSARVMLVVMTVIPHFHSELYENNSPLES